MWRSRLERLDEEQLLFPMLGRERVRLRVVDERTQDILFESRSSDT